MTSTRFEVVVVGAGAAGLLAATRAAERGRETLLLEKTSQPGTKILMSGGTRCNITHATDRRGIVQAFGPCGAFLHSSLAALGPQELVALIEAEGVATKTEPTGKIFPVSDRARDVLAALLARLQRSGCQLNMNAGVTDVEVGVEGFKLATPQGAIIAERLIITTGGQSYPRSGTAGDGYRWLAALGHTIVPPRPALTPITTSATWIAPLSGITVGDVGVRVVRGDGAGDTAGNGRSRTAGAVLAQARGSFLFTHFGLSGPSVLDVSRAVSGAATPSQLALECDFLPNMKHESLEDWFRAQCAEDGKRQLAVIASRQLPRRLVETLMRIHGIELEQRAADASRQHRRALIDVMKRTLIPINGTRGFGKAEVTAGGVDLAEVDSRTMESKLVPRLYLAGEILDLDGPIGGYNFQAAFSTGWLAGTHA